MDSNDFDVDDTASYGAACEATLVKAAVAPAAGKTQATTTSDDASSDEWGEVDAESSAGSSCCRDQNRQEGGYDDHRTSPTITPEHSRLCFVHNNDSKPPILPGAGAGDGHSVHKKKNGQSHYSTKSDGIIGSIISLLRPTISRRTNKLFY